MRRLCQLLAVPFCLAAAVAAAASALQASGAPSGEPARRAPTSVPSQGGFTASGIPIEVPWRAAVYAHAREKLQHPAWGWRHSERDFLLARAIARREGLTLDEDVLFAAAFLHDAGAIAPFAREGVDHSVRSAELAEPFLREAGFPAAKLPAVKAAILGHMSDADPGSRPEAIALHDADALDFLGATGIARRLGVNGAARDLDASLARAEATYREVPAGLRTRAAKRMARARLQAMKAFFDQLKRETPAGAPL